MRRGDRHGKRSQKDRQRQDAAGLVRDIKTAGAKGMPVGSQLYPADFAGAFGTKMTQKNRDSPQAVSVLFI